MDTGFERARVAFRGSQDVFEGEAERLAQVESVVQTIARQILLTGRTGTIEVDDLLQIGRAAALKQIRSFDPNGGVTVQSWCSFRVTREMKDFVRLQSADITISDDAQRGRRGEVTIEVEVKSRDAKVERSETKTNVVREEQDHITPEVLFGSAQERARISKAIDQLPAEEREIVQWHFGFGVPEKSIRELAHAWDMPRSRLDALLKRAKARLAKVLAEGED